MPFSDFRIRRFSFSPLHYLSAVHTFLKVKTALEYLPSIDNVTVSAADNGPNGGRQWLVTFSGISVEGNIDLLGISTTHLTGSGVQAVVSETTHGNEPAGRFMLETDTAPQGWPEHRSSWISIGASASDVEEALLQVKGIRAVDVSVNKSLPTVGPIAWDITFSHRQRVSKQDGTGEDDFFATGQSGNRAPVHVVRARLSGEGTKVEANTVQDGTRAIGGTYELHLRGKDDAINSTTIAAGASAAAVRLALVEDLGLSETTTVVRAGPLDENLAYTWTVTLAEGVNLWSNDSSDVVGELAVNASLLSGEGVFVNTFLVSVGAAPLGGTFNISFEDDVHWVSLAHNATDTEISTAISHFSASGGNVTVTSKEVTDWISDSYGGRQWTITFSALAAAGDVPMIIFNSSGLLTGTGVEVFVNETSKGVTADVQEITIDGFNGTFSFFTQHDGSSASNFSASSVNGTLKSSAPIRWDAGASDVETAMFEATGKRVYVERSAVSSSSGNSGGYTWLVLFAETINGTWGTVHLNTSHLVPDDDLLSGPYRQANITLIRNSTASAIGGDFSLRFGQTCEERAAGVYCSIAETAKLDIASSSSQVTTALKALPAILNASVSDSNYPVWDGVAETAPDGFGVSSAGRRFRVTLSAIVLNASDSAVAEYWRRTWVPETAATEWSGDVAIGGDMPLLGVDLSGMAGSHPAGRVEEVTKGLSTKVGGVVALEISQNAGRDYTSSGVVYAYESLVSVDALIPDHGPMYGGTEVRDIFYLISLFFYKFRTNRGDRVLLCSPARRFICVAQKVQLVHCS